MNKREETDVKFDSMDLLIAEFNHISQTQTQSKNQSDTSMNLYLLIVGGGLTLVLESTFRLNQNSLEIVNLNASIFSFIVAVISIIFAFRLARLRASWYECAYAMNQIKLYVQQYHPQIKDAFRWKSETLPAKYTVYSLGGLDLLLIASIGSIATTVFASLLIYYLGYSPKNLLPLSFIMGISYYLIIMKFYKRIIVKL